MIDIFVPGSAASCRISLKTAAKSRAGSRFSGSSRSSSRCRIALRSSALDACPIRSDISPARRPQRSARSSCRPTISDMGRPSQFLAAPGWKADADDRRSGLRDGRGRCDVGSGNAKRTFPPQEIDASVGNDRNGANVTVGNGVRPHAAEMPAKRRNRRLFAISTSAPCQRRHSRHLRNQASLPTIAHARRQ